MDSAASGPSGPPPSTTPLQASDAAAPSGPTAPVTADGTSIIPTSTSSPADPAAIATPDIPLATETHNFPAATTPGQKQEPLAFKGTLGTLAAEHLAAPAATAATTVTPFDALEIPSKEATPVVGDTVAPAAAVAGAKSGQAPTDPAAAVQLPEKAAAPPINEVTAERTSSEPEVSAGEVAASEVAQPPAKPAFEGFAKATIEPVPEAAPFGQAEATILSEVKTPTVAMDISRLQDALMSEKSPPSAAPATAPVLNDAPPATPSTNSAVMPSSVTEKKMSASGLVSTPGVPARAAVPASEVALKDSLSRPSALDAAAPSTAVNGAIQDLSPAVHNVAIFPSQEIQESTVAELPPASEFSAIVEASTDIPNSNQAVAVDAVAPGVAGTVSMQVNTPAGVVQGSGGGSVPLPLSSSPAVGANGPAPSLVRTAHAAALANARVETPQPVTGSSTPMSVENAGISPMQDVGGSLPNSQTGMLHAPTWEKLQEAAKESRMAWTHPSQSRQVETDVLHLCRAIVKLPELNLTQSFISQRSGVSQGTLSHYVRGLHQGNQRSVEERLSNFLRRFCDGEFDQMIPVPGAERPKPMPAMPRAPLSRPSSAAAQGLGHNSLGLNAPAAGPPVNMTNAIYHQPYPAESIAHHQQMMENMAAAAFARSAHANGGAAGAVPMPVQSPVLTMQQQQQQQLQLHAQRLAQQQHQQIHQQQVIDRVRANAVTAAQASAQQGMVMTPASATQPVPPGGGMYAPQNNNQPFKRPRPMYGAPLPDDTAAVTSRDAVEKAFHASKAVSWNDANGTSEPLLLPVEVHVDIDGLVVYTFVQWDVNERIKSPESLAKEMREERDLPVEFEHAIACAIRRSLFNAGVVPPPPPPAADADAQDGGEENLRVIKIVVELNDDDGQTQILKDSFEWDIGAGGGDVWNSPETFSQTLCADAGIAQKHAAAVSRAIRHELSRAHAIAYGDEETKQTALSQVGLASSCAKKLPVVGTALRRLSGEELLIQRREENEVMVHSMFVKPILTEVEIECRRREVSRKLEIEMAQQREKEQEEAEKTAKLAATRDAALREAERDRLEANRKAKDEDGLDITPYTSLKLGYNSHPSIWIQGVAERKEAKEPLLPASGLAAAAIAEAEHAEPASIPNSAKKVNGVSDAVKRERPEGVVNDSDPSKFVAVEAEDGTILRLPLKEEGVADGDE